MIDIALMLGSLNIDPVNLFFALPLIILCVLVYMFLFWFVGPLAVMEDSDKKVMITHAAITLLTLIIWWVASSIAYYYEKPGHHMKDIIRITQINQINQTNQINQQK